MKLSLTAPCVPMLFPWAQKQTYMCTDIHNCSIFSAYNGIVLNTSHNETFFFFPVDNTLHRSSHDRICRFAFFFLNGHKVFHGWNALKCFKHCHCWSLRSFLTSLYCKQCCEGTPLYMSSFVYMCFSVAGELLDQSRYVHLKFSLIPV